MNKALKRILLACTVVLSAALRADYLAPEIPSGDPKYKTVKEFIDWVGQQTTPQHYVNYTFKKLSFEFALSVNQDPYNFFDMAIRVGGKYFFLPTKLSSIDNLYGITLVKTGTKGIYLVGHGFRRNATTGKSSRVLMTIRIGTSSGNPLSSLEYHEDITPNTREFRELYWRVWLADPMPIVQFSSAIGVKDRPPFTVPEAQPGSYDYMDMVNLFDTSKGTTSPWYQEFDFHGAQIRTTMFNNPFMPGGNLGLMVNDKIFKIPLNFAGTDSANTVTLNQTTGNGIYLIQRGTRKNSETGTVDRVTVYIRIAKPNGAAIPSVEVSEDTFPTKTSDTELFYEHSRMGH